jgi:hypothetical protein
VGIWEVFLKKTFLATASESVKSVLAEIGSALRRKVETGHNPLEFVDRANLVAHHKTRDMLTSHGLGHLLSTRPLPVLVKADFDGRSYCAETSPASHWIILHFQYGQHGLWGALVMDYIFRHEYLSHLVPKSAYLRNSVREGWLISTLLEEARNERDNPHASLSAFLLLKFRRELARALGQDEDSIFSPPDFEMGAVRIRSGSPLFFWSLNSDILAIDHDAEDASLLDRILMKLTLLPDLDLHNVTARGDWSGIQHLWERLNV